MKEGIPHVQPPTAILEQMLTVRIHLDRTDESNGALKVIPGSHRQGKLSNLEIDGSKYLQVFLAIAKLGKYSCCDHYYYMLHRSRVSPVIAE